MSDEKFVVVSKVSADADDYVRAVVHTDEESANAYLAEVKASAPWQAHSVVPVSKFEKDSEKAVKAAAAATGKEEH